MLRDDTTWLILLLPRVESAVATLMALMKMIRRVAATLMPLRCCH